MTTLDLQEETGTDALHELGQGNGKVAQDWRGEMIISERHGIK